MENHSEDRHKYNQICKSVYKYWHCCRNQINRIIQLITLATHTIYLLTNLNNIICEACSNETSHANRFQCFSWNKHYSEGVCTSVGMNATASETNRCAVIKFLTLEGSNPMNIHRRMLTVYDGTCMSKLTVTRWVRMFSGVRQKTTEMLRPVRCTKL